MLTGVAKKFVYALAVALFACVAVWPAYAQSNAAEEPEQEQEQEPKAKSKAEEFDEALDEMAIDVADSIGDALEARGLSVKGDFRVGQIFAGDEFDDVRFGENDTLRARWRIRSTLGITENIRGVLRVAGLCSTDDCSPDFDLQWNIPTGAGMKDGQITIDEFFIQKFRSDRFNVAIGRMQVKSVARGGVFSKSLNHNDSNNLRVNWTDGVHATFKAKNGWDTHMVLQYNSEDGPGNVRRTPLDFSDSSSRVSSSFGFQNLQDKRRLVQRSIDINYYPSALMVDGLPGGEIDDYWAIIARGAARWPVRTDSWRLRFSGEVGYAPTTPTKTAAGILGTGNADGVAWNITASVMDFVPHHSIGINYAHTGSGWLVSPQYTNNQSLVEIRYMWRPTKRLTMDARARWREELDQKIVEIDNHLFDFYIRFTWSFSITDD